MKSLVTKVVGTPRPLEAQTLVAVTNGNKLLVEVKVMFDVRDLLSEPA
jgi:hypothetical protein